MDALIIASFIIGAGFGKPSPVIGLPMTIVLATPESGEHPVSRTKTEAHSMEVRTRAEDMGGLLLAGCASRQNIPVASEVH